MNSDLRHLPSVDRLISDRRIQSRGASYTRELVLQLTREHLDRVRADIAAGKPAPSLDQMVESICARLDTISEPTQRPVINATGVILHTNLGRAPLSREATAAMQHCARAYTNLEIDLDSGRRGSRLVHVESLLCLLTGAEAALVVNNNAGGVLLALTALARRKEVIVSRGQAVEIGGGFRIPDVMRQSGAKLVEVGTTNRTRLSDYEEGITPRTAALLRVHSSNFDYRSLSIWDGATTLPSSTTWAAAACWTPPATGWTPSRRCRRASKQGQVLPWPPPINCSGALRQRRGRDRGADMAHDRHAPRRDREARPQVAAGAGRLRIDN